MGELELKHVSALDNANGELCSVPMVCSITRASQSTGFCSLFGYSYVAKMLAFHSLGGLLYCCHPPVALFHGLCIRRGACYP